MFDIKIDYSELDGVKRAVASFSQELNLTGVESEVEDVVRDAVIGQFATLGKRSGEPWKPLADGSGERPLDDTGDLETAVTNPKVELSEGGRRINVSFSGPHSELFAFHQRGSKIRRKAKGKSKRKVIKITIPARPMLSLIAEDIDRISGIAFNRLKSNFGNKLKRKIK